MIKVVKLFSSNQNFIHRGLSTKFVQLMAISGPLTVLRQGQICIPMHLYGEYFEKSFSQNF